MEKLPKSLVNEDDVRIYDKDEIKTSLTEEINPRDLTADVLGFDAIEDLRERKHEKKAVKLNYDDFISEKYLKTKVERKPLKKSIDSFTVKGRLRTFDKSEINTSSF